MLRLNSDFGRGNMFLVVFASILQQSAITCDRTKVRLHNNSLLGFALGKMFVTNLDYFCGAYKALSSSRSKKYFETLIELEGN